MTNKQDPMTKQKPITNIQSPNLEFVDWVLKFAWNLSLGVWLFLPKQVRIK